MQNLGFESGISNYRIKLVNTKNNNYFITAHHKTSKSLKLVKVTETSKMTEAGQGH